MSKPSLIVLAAGMGSLYGGLKQIDLVEGVAENDSWFGVTYREDRFRVAESVQLLVTRGDYPKRLWT